VEAGNVNFHEIAQVVGPAIDQVFIYFSFHPICTDLLTKILKHFSKDKIRVISEPGRYFATECVTLAANIVSKRERPNPTDPSKPIVQYYLSDGGCQSNSAVLCFVF